MIKKDNPQIRLIILIVVLLSPFILAKAYWGHLTSPLNLNGETRVFVIAPGESVSQVADRLEKEKFIKSSLAFKITYRLSNSQKIEAGDFKISPSMSLDEMLKTLSQGSIDKWVTLIEGWRVEEIASKLNKELGIKSAEFIAAAKNHEGFLFPDTYLFNPDARVEDVISIMRANFDKKYDDQLKSKIKSKGLTDHQGVILASLVEREARSNEVRTKVASILLKRLNLGMKLDVDATVRYAKDENTLKQGKNVEKFWQPITREDYSQVLSPFNTYLHNGLPPTPICNPSLASLKAVANADPSIPFLFYLHDSKGNSYYAKTLEEHNQNVANHRK